MFSVNGLSSISRSVNQYLLRTMLCAVYAPNGFLLFLEYVRLISGSFTSSCPQAINKLLMQT